MRTLLLLLHPACCARCANRYWPTATARATPAELLRRLLLTAAAIWLLPLIDDVAGVAGTNLAACYLLRSVPASHPHDAHAWHPGWGVSVDSDGSNFAITENDHSPHAGSGLNYSSDMFSSQDSGHTSGDSSTARGLKGRRHMSLGAKNASMNLSGDSGSSGGSGASGVLERTRPDRIGSGSKSAAATPRSHESNTKSGGRIWTRAPSTDTGTQRFEQLYDELKYQYWDDDNDCWQSYSAKMDRKLHRGRGPPGSKKDKIIINDSNNTPIEFDYVEKVRPPELTVRIPA